MVCRAASIESLSLLRRWGAIRGILAALAFTFTIVVSAGQSHACSRAEKAVEPAAAAANAVDQPTSPDIAALEKWPAVSASGGPVVWAENVQVASKPIGCCGDDSHHAGDVSCALGTCAACCAAADIATEPLLLTGFSSRYLIPFAIGSRFGTTVFLFRPPRSSV